MTTALLQVTVNGRSLSVPPGTTVMEATKQLGVDVPHYCWHPGLSVAGVCRFCMVKIEGMPKLQIACNTAVTDGMKVDTLSSEVKDAHKWALEFHLINHPLDCPICDQAGECELQNYYMKVGRYSSQMTQNKVLKPKALDVGDTLVLDTERCILCSRCVRFEDEVTKTGSLGFFNRGDQTVISTFENRKIQHNYSYNLADICPVGAFTSKDFRFKMRVWFMKEVKTICPGCSTGCNVTLFYNKNQRTALRLKPRHNPEVNGYWMCDKGRFMYLHTNASERIHLPKLRGQEIGWNEALKELGAIVHALPAADAQKIPVAFVLTPQYTNEEYEAIFSFIKQIQGPSPSVYIWRDDALKPEDFDGILWRGDQNPNTKGLWDAASKASVTLKTCSPETCQPELKDALVFVWGPEIPQHFPNIEKMHEAFGKLDGRVCYFGNAKKVNPQPFWLQLPTLVFSEKGGSFTNYKGIRQSLTPGIRVFPQTPDLEDFLHDLVNSKPLSSSLA